MDHQLDTRSRSWTLSVLEQRRRAQRQLRKNPGLKRRFGCAQLLSGSQACLGRGRTRGRALTSPALACVQIARAPKGRSSISPRRSKHSRRQPSDGWTLPWTPKVASRSLWRTSDDRGSGAARRPPSRRRSGSYRNCWAPACRRRAVPPPRRRGREFSAATAAPARRCRAPPATRPPRFRPR